MPAGIGENELVVARAPIASRAGRRVRKLSVQRGAAALLLKEIGLPAAAGEFGVCITSRLKVMIRANDLSLSALPACGAEELN